MARILRLPAHAIPNAEFYVAGPSLALRGACSASPKQCQRVGEGDDRRGGPVQLGALAGIGRLPWEPGTVVYDQDLLTDRPTG